MPMLRFRRPCDHADSPCRGHDAKTIPIVQMELLSGLNGRIARFGLPIWYWFGIIRETRGESHGPVSRRGRGRQRAAGRRWPTRRARVLGRGEGGPANIWTDPDGRARQHPRGRAARRWRRAGGGALADLRAVLGVAGANVPEAAGRLAAGLPFAAARGSRRTPSWRSRARSATADGIVAAIGTGSVYGVQRGGAVRIIGGWGFLLGDQGSGAWIGRSLLEAALLAHDGLGGESAAARRGPRRARRAGGDRRLRPAGEPGGLRPPRAAPARRGGRGRSRCAARSSPRRRATSRGRSTG